MTWQNHIPLINLLKDNLSWPCMLMRWIVLELPPESFLINYIFRFHSPSATWHRLFFFNPLPRRCLTASSRHHAPVVTRVMDCDTCSVQCSRTSTWWCSWEWAFWWRSSASMATARLASTSCSRLSHCSGPRCVVASSRWSTVASPLVLPGECARNWINKYYLIFLFFFDGICVF